MKKNIAIIYKSKYGTTKQYSEWIADELNASLLNAEEVKADQLRSFDVVIYGGGLYAGGIDGVKLVTKNLPKKLVVFTVGLANPKITDYTDILNKNFAPDLLANIKVFHLRGGMDYKKLSFIHKGMMSMVCKSTAKKPETERTEEDKLFLETYGQKINFLDTNAIAPLVDYVRNLGD